MKSFLASALLAVAVLAAQQPPVLKGPERSRLPASGYAYFGISPTFDCDCGATLNFGFGGDGFVYRGLGLGGDLGYLFSSQAPIGGIGVLSLNPSYHIASPKTFRKFIPFVNTGYTLLFRGESLSLYNIGGGATYWFKDKLGLRAEFRDFRHPEWGRAFYTIRVAVAFR